MATINFPRDKYVLYAEDDIDDRTLLEQIMETMPGPIDLIIMENGQEVLDYLHALPQSAPYPCFILLDINMPVMDGYETLKRLKEDPRYHSIAVILYSTADYEQQEHRARQAGAKRYISKPFSVALIEKICISFASMCRDEPQLYK
jgi:CheY-like chemotaxis protein